MSASTSYLEEVSIRNMIWKPYKIDEFKSAIQITKEEPIKKLTVKYYWKCILSLEKKVAIEIFYKLENILLFLWTNCTNAHAHAQVQAHVQGDAHAHARLAETEK